MIKARLIALGDLGHTTKLLANNFVPLNIGFIAAYLERRFGTAIEVRLFKDPHRLLAFILAEAPDLVAASNYAWNRAISLHVLQRYKAIVPRGISVLGGPNFPKDAAPMREVLRRHRFLDFAVENEGEASMAGLIERLLEAEFDAQPVRQAPMPGVFSLDGDGALSHAPCAMMRELDDIPSPYLSGHLDSFLLEDVGGTTLIPMIEGARGCPFACTFCRAGIETNKIRRFGTARISAEIDYIARLYKRHDRRVSSLLITDQNFGSLPRDAEIADVLRRTGERFGFPLSVMATSGKTNVDAVLDTMARYPGMAMTMSVQSMDDAVLGNIKRKNFPVEKYEIYQRELKAQGKLSKSDIIVGLPGETHDSHLASLRGILEVGIDVIDPFTFMMLLGTEAEMPEQRARYGYTTRWRLLPGGFSDFDGTKALESEEVVVATDAMSFEDYVHLRRVHLLLVTICNGTIFRELKKLIFERGLDIVAFLLRVEAALSEPGRAAASGAGSVARVLDDFTRKTRGELFESKAALDAFYGAAANYNDLCHDRAGENLLQKHRYAMFLRQGDLAETVLGVLRAFLRDEGCLRPEDESVMALLRARSQCVEGLLAGQPVGRREPVHFDVDHDVLAWRASENRPLERFRLAAPISLAAYTPYDVIERLERTIADGGHRDFEKARTLYRLGIEALLPTIAPATQLRVTAPAHAEGRAAFGYVVKVLAPGE